MTHSSILVVFCIGIVNLSHATNRDSVMDMVITKLGLTFYTQAQLTVIAKCCEPQFYATPNNNTAILSVAKNCVLQNSGNKAVQALALYNNVVQELVPPVVALTDPLVKQVKKTLSDCKSTNTQTGDAKQEACIQKVYGVTLAALTLKYVDNVCTQIVNENVSPQEWTCGLKYIPSVLTFSKYACSKIVKN
ncbi:hypothetical protein GCK72_018381 [Caenorhabditis remanei]|uniref:Uncharacterized protein n=1 Tax=Caenorhabditis remanei TaxID=31234 RepID=A0A6A5G9M8_CAERE|nr:hypothetical protein GCK72_018381 [Caenorhabditis remanei]KAF1751827.1 hypothetical protein GCK72_018381 [Caenorhabditis remanei]